jgi:RNA recognition motif-containing protein
LSLWHHLIGIGHLLTSRPDASLEAAFQVVGQVKQAVVLRERTNFKATGNGLGYVTFVREDDAQRAVEQLDGLLFQGRAISLEITSTPEQAKQIRETSEEVQLATQPCPPLTHTVKSSCKQQRPCAGEADIVSFPRGAATCSAGLAK